MLTLWGVAVITCWTSHDLSAVVELMSNEYKPGITHTNKGKHATAVGEADQAHNQCPSKCDTSAILATIKFSAAANRIFMHGDEHGSHDVSSLSLAGITHQTVTNPCQQITHQPTAHTHTHAASHPLKRDDGNPPPRGVPWKPGQ